MEPLDSNVAFKYIWYSWRICGIYPTKKYKILYYIYSVIKNSIVTFFFPISLSVNNFFEEKIEVVLGNLSMSLTIVASAFKYFTVLIYQKRFSKIKLILNKLDSRAQDDDEQEYLRKVIKKCHIMYFLYNGVYYPALLLYIIVPLIVGQRLIFAAWFPFDWRKYYWPVYIYQAIATTFIVIENIADDLFPPAYIYMLLSHVHVLGMRIQKVGRDPRKTSTENYQDIVSCIHDHREILKLFEHLRHVITRTLFIQFIVTAFALCLAAVYIMSYAQEMFEIMAVIIYLGAVILEVLPACFFVNLLVEENDYLTTSIYSCNWMDQNQSFKRTVIIFMQRTHKTFVMLAGNLVPINLPTFLAIIKFTFSLFTILNQINNKPDGGETV